jgi:hypothetical protein
MIDFFRYASHFDFCAVEYEKWFDNPDANLEKLRKFLNLPWQQSEADLALLLSDIIDPSARHDDPGRREASQPLVRTLYKLASRAGQDGTRDQIAYIVSQFVSFQQLQRPLLQAFEGVAKTAAKYPEIEQEAAALRTAVGERDAVIEAAERRASQAESRVADAAAEIEAQRGEIAKLAGAQEARAEIEREAGGLRAALTEREAAFAELSRRADELQAALTEREAAFVELSRRADELQAAQQAALVDLAAREAALHSAERGAQERTASEAAFQGEIVGLRATLANAERAAQERTSAAVASQAEISGLKEALAAARQVGKVAIAALCVDAVAPARPSGLRGWRRAVMRVIGA